MQTFETAAIISLIDHLSGPLQALVGKANTQVNRMQAMGKSMVHAGQHMTWAVSMPVTAGLTHLANASKMFSEQENTLRGVLANRAQFERMSTQESERFVAQQEEVVRSTMERMYWDKEQTRGMLDTLEFRKSVVQGIKANMDAEQAAAAASQAFHLALAGRIDQHEATEHLINISQAFGLITKNADGSKKSVAEMNDQFQRYADIMAVMSSNANMSVSEAADALKFSAPLANMAHIHPSVIAAMHEAQSELGFKGSEAGVNLRSWLLSLMAPKSTAVPAMRQFGIDLNKFYGFEGLSPEAAVKFFRGQGINLDMKYARNAFKRAETDEGSLDVTKLGDAMIGHLERMGKSKAPITPDLAVKKWQQFANSHMAQTNVLGALMAMRDAHLPPGALALQMEKRQIPRSWAYLSGAEGGEKQNVFANAMARMFGSQWEDVLRRASEMKDLTKQNEYIEQHVRIQKAAVKQAQEHSSGMEGAYLRLGAAWTYLQDRLHSSGALKWIEDMLHQIANMFERVGSMDTESLSNLTKGLAALAALGPGLVVAGLALQGLSGLSVLASLPVAAVAALVVALTQIPGAAEAAKGALSWMASDGLPGIARGVQTLMESVKGIFSTIFMIIGEHLNVFKGWGDAAAQKASEANSSINGMIDGLAKQLSHALDDKSIIKNADGTPGGASLKASLAGLASVVSKPVDVGVQGRVNGEVEIHQSMRIEPSPLFLAKMAETQNAVARVDGSIMKLGQTMRGNGNSPVRSGGPSVLAPAPGPLKL